MARILVLLSILFLDTSTISMNGLTSPPKTLGEVQYLMRTVDVLTFGPSNESLTLEAEWRRRGMEQVYSTKFKIVRTFELSSILIRFERCRDLELACEDFQTWNITPVLFCEGIKMKNQIWSTIVETIKPKTLFQNCPRLQFKQGVYRMDNITLRTDVILKFYNEAVKYYWKWHGIYYNLKKEIEMRTFSQSYFVKYIKRDRVNKI